jgi:CheY-like chemotaxis protein
MKTSDIAEALPVPRPLADEFDGEQPERGPAMAKIKVLLIDDERSFTRLLKANLEATGEFDVRVENWPEDACGTAREFQPQIILLDLVMPRMPGGNVRAQLEADPELREIPIVLLTGAVHPRSDTDGWNEGIPYLIKPVSDEKVAEMIRQHARKEG